MRLASSGQFKKTSNFQENFKKIGIFLEVLINHELLRKMWFSPKYLILAKSTTLWKIRIFHIFLKISNIGNGCCRGLWFSTQLLAKYEANGNNREKKALKTSKNTYISTSKNEKAPNPSRSVPSVEKSRKTTIFLEFRCFQENHEKSHFSILYNFEKNQEKPPKLVVSGSF